MASTVNGHKVFDLKEAVPPIKKSAQLTNEHRKQLYFHMIQAREFDLAMQRLNRQGKAFGGVYSQKGNEATAVGSAFALGEKDILFPMHRDIGSHFVFKADTKQLMLNHLAKDGSQMRGTDGTGHYADVEKRIYGNVSHLGAMIPVAAGFVLASKMRNEPIVAMTYIGDGGAQTGEFHEGVNFASVQKLPLVVIIENNQYAYSSPNSVEFAAERLSDRAIGYGCYGSTIDGTDIEVVFDECKKAVEQARVSGIPALIETVTMRMRGHAEHDDAGYVPKETFEYWELRDPIKRYEDFLKAEGIYTDEDIVKIKSDVSKDMKDAIDYALELPYPAAEEGKKFVFVP
jgi:TPP-dependent pyruvate/acetoin dehydrogenase alpha subunit